MQKMHFYLIAGTVMFSFPGEEGQEDRISSIPANAIVRHTKKLFPAHKLAKAQQNLTKSFLMKMPEEMHSKININDILIQNVSYLGLMTEDEFQQPPEGMALAEAAVKEVI